MGADQAREWLIEFACDGIDPAREAQFSAWLNADPELAAEWAEITEVNAVLARVPAFEPDNATMAALRANIGQALDHTKVRRSWLVGRLNLAAAGAAACLLVGLLAVGVHPPREPQAADHVAGVAPKDRAEEHSDAAPEAAEITTAPAEPALGAAPTEPVTTPEPPTRMAAAPPAEPPTPKPAASAPPAAGPRTRPHHAAPAPRRSSPRRDAKPADKPKLRTSQPVVASRTTIEDDTAEARMSSVPTERGPVDILPDVGAATSPGGGAGTAAAPAPRPASPATSPTPSIIAAEAAPETVAARVVTGVDLSPVVGEALRVSRASQPVLFALRPASPPVDPASADLAAGTADLVVDSAVIESVVLPGGGLTGRDTR